MNHVEDTNKNHLVQWQDQNYWASQRKQFETPDCLRPEGLLSCQKDALLVWSMYKQEHQTAL